MKDIVNKIDGSIVAKTILGTIPWTGGAMAAISHIAEQEKTKRLESLIAEAIEEIRSEIDNRINSDYFYSENFYSRFSWVDKTLDGMSAGEKRTYLKIYLKKLLSQRLSEEELYIEQMYIRYMSILQSIHLKVIDYVYDLQLRFSDDDLLKRTVKIKGVLPIEVGDISNSLPGLDINMARAVVSDLIGLGLFGDWAMYRRDGVPQSSIFILPSARIFVEFARSST